MRKQMIFFSNIDEDMRYVKYYKRHTQSSFDLNCDSKFMNPMFWHRVHDHLTSHKIYRDTKDKIHQVMYLFNTSSIIDITDGKNIIKESRLSYIRSIIWVKRLKLYNCSNINGLDNVVHKSGQVVVEMPNGCLILFIRDNLHVGGSAFHRVDESNPSNLLFFSYIIEKNYITGNEKIT